MTSYQYNSYDLIYIFDGAKIQRKLSALFFLSEYTNKLLGLSGKKGQN